MRLNVRRKPVVKETRPRSLKIARRIRFAESLLHQLGPFNLWCPKQRIEQFDFRKSSKKREDHWLN